MIEPVAETLEPQEPRTGAFGWLVNAIAPPLNLHEELERGLESFEQNLQAQDDSTDLQPEVGVEILEDINGFKITGRWDPRYLMINEALVGAGRDVAAAHEKSAILMGVMRGLLGRGSDAFTFDGFDYTPGETDAIVIAMTTPEPLEATAAEDLRRALEDTDELAEVLLTQEGQAVTLTITPSNPLPEAEPLAGPVVDRLMELTGDDEYAARNLKFFYDRVEASASSRPVFLNTARPVLKQGYAPARYEYFYSSYTLMIFTDFIGLGVIALIFLLEKQGKIHRYGVEEDENR